MIIDQLPSVGTPALTDETVTEQGQNLFKVTWQHLLALFKGNTTLSELTNDAGFVNASGAAAAAPVQSVNGQTGAVTVPTPPTPTYNQTNITSGTHDLNDYTTPGLYYFSSGATLSNAPNSAVNGWLWVLKSTGNQFKQIWVRHGSNPNTTKDFYMRFYSGSWGDWFGWMNRWELLWTNASPTSSFVAQNVTLATGYDIILIFFASDTASGHSSRIKSVMFPTDVANPGFYVDFSNGSDKYIGSRIGTFTVSTGVLNVAQGYYNGSTNNSWCLPQCIYGIKGVQ